MADIALLSYDYPPNDGGISRLLSSVVSELNQRGVSSNVLTLQSGGRRGAIRPSVPTVEVARGNPRRDLGTLRYLYRLPASMPVLASVWNPEATLAWLAGQRRLFVMAHGNEVMPYPKSLRFRLKDGLRRHVLGRAQAVICNSRYTEQLVRACQDEAKTVVICPAVDAERFVVEENPSSIRVRLQLPLEKRLILSVSRINAYKGYDVVLNALAALPAEIRAKLQYAIAGRGEALPALQQQALELGLMDCVTWLGFVDDRELPALYASADLFILCTREDPKARGVEGFGMVFLEAQAAGLPVVGTRAGGIPDAIVEGEGGRLVPQDDVEAVVVHLRKLVEHPDLFREQGRLGRARVRRDATWEHYVDELLRVMEMHA